MKKQLALIALLATSFTFTACSKQEKAPASEVESSEVATSTENDKVTPEQQAAIDAIDQPVLDEKNKDVPAEIANKPADAVTPHEENVTPKAQ